MRPWSQSDGPTDRGLGVLFLLLVFGTPFLFLLVVLLLDREDEAVHGPLG